MSLNDYQVRLVHSLADLQQCLSALTWIDELEPEEEISRVELRRYRCLEDAAVVAYWRPFSISKGLPKLNFKRLGIAPAAAERELHEELGVHRNKVVAHTDMARMRLGFHTFKPGRGRGLVLPHLIRDDSLAFYGKRGEWMNWVGRLTASISDIVYEEAQRLGEINYVTDYLRDSSSP